VTRWYLILAAVAGGAIWLDADSGLTAIAQFANPEIDESSGLAKSTKYPGVYWTINDSGNPPILYAFDLTGKSVGDVLVQRSRNVDWEALAYESGVLYVGDIGDNPSRRDEVRIWTVPEPDPRVVHAAPATLLRLRYPDGAHNAEAMFARDGWLYVVIKQLGSAPLGVYRANSAWSTKVKHVFEKVVTISPGEMITGGDINADGTRIALTGYNHVFVFIGRGEPREVLATRPHKFALGRSGQTEAVVFDGLDLILTNEQGQVFRLKQRAYETAPLAGAAGGERP